MTTHFDTMTNWEREKAQFILRCSLNLGMRIDGYGELALNQFSGNVYLWLEDYPFALYMPINCDLSTEDVFVLWTDTNDGTEHEMSLSNFSDLEDIYQWCNELEIATN